MIVSEQDLVEQVKILSELRLPERARVLEAGCGTGPLLRELARQRPMWRLTGVDLSCGSLSLGCMAAAAERCGIDFLQLDLRKLPFADGSFDLVYTRDVLDHLEDREATLAELERVLHPDGVLILFERTTKSST
ncbi:class I SAM-dependent methyltransferase [Tumebacillus lipolyticus]|uniref:Class I SAM-dependent methyltransferase n=1 Tax=Tumebacillus lipolyticus TaxID=1280370 RepID=A0ABW4ZYC1_9BACL